MATQTQLEPCGSYHTASAEQSVTRHSLWLAIMKTKRLALCANIALGASTVNGRSVQLVPSRAPDTIRASHLCMRLGRQPERVLRPACRRCCLPRASLEHTHIHAFFTTQVAMHNRLLALSDNMATDFGAPAEAAPRTGRVPPVLGSHKNLYERRDTVENSHAPKI